MNGTLATREQLDRRFRSMVSGQATIFYRGSNIYCAHERFWINDGSWEGVGQPLRSSGLWVTIDDAIDRYLRMQAAGACMASP